MNKILPICLLTLLSLNVFAAPFDGFYAGAGIGGVRGTFNNNITTDASLVFGGTLQQDIAHNNSPTLSDGSWAGELDLGFGRVFYQSLYLGVEGTGQLENISNTNSFQVMPNDTTGITYTRQIKTQLQNELALTFNPGIVLHKTTLLYGKIGPSWGRFSVNDTFNFGELIGPGQQLSGMVNVNDGSSYQCGLRLGLGIEHYMTKHFSFRLEYLNTNYSTIRSGKTHSAPILLNGVADPVIAGSTVSSSDHISAHSNSVMFDINYHIGA
ncbi:MAG: outer membrane protein [Gammaproteobacteria bacterium]